MLHQFNKQAVITKTLNEVASSLIYAIQRGIKDVISEEPIACLKREGEGLCINVIKPDDHVEKLLKIFPDACKQYKVVKLSGIDTFASKRVINPNLIKYEFNISIEDFHKMMMTASDYYQGYRVGNSLLHLKNPNMFLLKEGKICICPVYKLSQNKVMLRLAGCNTSEILSTQLAFLIKEYLPEETGEVYGHHISPMLEKLGFSEFALFDVITSYLKIFRYNLKLHEKKKEIKFEEDTIYIQLEDNVLHFTLKEYPGKHFEKTIKGTIDTSKLHFELESLTQEKLDHNQEDILKIISEKSKLRPFNQINHQSEDGFRVVILNDKTKDTLIEMNPEALNIYSALGPVQISELKELKSIEFPVLDFLSELKKIQENNLKEVLANKNVSQIPELGKSIDILEQLITKIKEQNNEYKAHKISL